MSSWRKSSQFPGKWVKENDKSVNSDRKLSSSNESITDVDTDLRKKLKTNQHNINEWWWSEFLTFNYN